jgi:hypothetical protein
MLAMRESATRNPTRVLDRRYARDVVEALAALFPAGHYAAVDSRGRPAPLEVFVTRERRGARQVTCGVRLVSGRLEFALDDGADEFAASHLAGAPAFDAHGNVGISVVMRALDQPSRGCSLWIAHDLSSLAIEDELYFLR